MSSVESTPLPEGQCSFARCVAVYFDGELDPGRILEVEAHLVRCAACSERLQLLRATRASLRRSTAKAPESLRARCALAIVACSSERADAQDTAPPRGASRRPSNLEAPRLIGLRYAMGLSAAAVMVLAVGAWRVDRSRQRAHAGGPSTQMAANLAMASSLDRFSSDKEESIDRVLDDLVALHAKPLPPETTNPDEITRFDAVVGVPVRRPAFKPFHASFKGARLHASHNRRTVLLQYTVPCSVVPSVAGARQGEALQAPSPTDVGMDGAVDGSADERPLDPKDASAGQFVASNPSLLPIADAKRNPRDRNRVLGSSPVSIGVTTNSPNSEDCAHRVTMYVFDSRAFPVGRLAGFRERRVEIGAPQQAGKSPDKSARSLPVYVGEWRGYSVAATERQGISYAVATDLDPERSVELVAAAY